MFQDTALIESVIPVSVKFLINDKEQELKLKMKCPTASDYDKYMASFNQYGPTEYEYAYGPVAGAFIGWEDVLGPDGEPLEFSKEKLVEFQKKYHGLTDAIVMSVIVKMGEVRGKNYLSLATTKRAKKTKGFKNQTP